MILLNTTIIVIAILILAVVIIVASMLLSSQKKIFNEIKLRFTTIERSTKLVTHTNVPLVNSFGNVPFKRAFEENGLEEIVTDNALEMVNSFFHSLLPNIPESIDMVKSVINKPDKIVFTLSDKGKMLLKTGQAEIVKTADGKKIIPQIRGINDKKIKEMFKANIGRNALQLTRLANAAVSLAHVISSMDIVNKIEKLNNKVDLIIAGHQNEKISKLESCYRLVSEINKVDNTAANQQKLFDVHHDLLCLRGFFKRDMEYVIKNVKNPDDKFFYRIFRSKKAKDKEVNEAATEFDESLRLFDFAVKFDFALCLALRHPMSINEDIYAVEELTTLLTEKEKFLSDISQSTDIKRYAEYLNNCITKYKQFEDCLYYDCPPFKQIQADEGQANRN